MKKILFLCLTSLLFISCSTRQYYEPNEEEVEFPSSKKTNKTPLDSKIKTFNRKSATLEDGTVILDDGIQNIKLKKGFIFLNKQKEKIISANNEGLVDIDSLEIDLEKVVVAASIKENLLAVVFVDNSIGLYDISKKQMVFKDYYKESLANDIRISNPIFLKDIVLYPTLDGKVIVVSRKNPKVLRTIIVDTNSKFNNISFFDIADNSLIAATANQIISLNGSSLLTKKIEIRDIFIKDKHIYIATLDGQILKLDSSLNLLAKTKFKYAKIYSLGYKENKVFAIESQHFLIQLDENLKKQKVYYFIFDNDAKSVLLGDKIYYQLRKISKKNYMLEKKDFYITLP